MNHGQSLGYLFGFLLMVFMICVVFTSSSVAYDSISSQGADDQWTLIDRQNDSFQLYVYLNDRGYISNNVTFSDFDYIFTLTQQLCGMTEDVTPSLIIAMIAIESNFDTDMRSGNAYGLMQIIPSYHYNRLANYVESSHELSAVDFLDPRLCVTTGIDYIDELVTYSHGNIEYALMCYNQGIGSASKSYYLNGVVSAYAEKIVKLSKEIDNLIERGFRDVCNSG